MTKRTVRLVGAPVDEGAGRRGCLMGPDAYRTAGLKKNLEDLGHQVHDDGNLVCPETGSLTCNNPAVHHLEEIAGWTRVLFETSRKIGVSGEFPIYMGGDHALALGTVPGQAAAAAELDRPLYVLWLDAHSDFHSLETTESGNLHGTPLAYACGLKGFDVLLGKPLEHVVDPSHVEILGVRSIDPQEHKFLLEAGAGVDDMRRIDEHGIAALLQPFLDRVAKNNGLLHVSLDVDFLDPSIAPAVGTTVPGGATFREAHLVMEMLHDSGLVTSLDLVELNPFLDDRGKTARLMVDLTASLFGRKVFDRPTRSF